MWRNSVQRATIALAIVTLLALKAPSMAAAGLAMPENVELGVWLTADYYPYGDPFGEPVAASNAPDPGYYPYGDPFGEPVAASNAPDPGYYPYGDPFGEPVAASNAPLISDPEYYPYGDPSGPPLPDGDVPQASQYYPYGDPAG